LCGQLVDMNSILDVKMVLLHSGMPRKFLLFVSLNFYVLEILDALNGHGDGICKLQWIEKDNMLITGGKDKKLRVIIYVYMFLYLFSFINCLMSGEIRD